MLQPAGEPWGPLEGKHLVHRRNSCIKCCLFAAFILAVVGPALAQQTHELDPMLPGSLKPEPLPQESPLWTHPRVTVMPHVARRPTVAQLVTEIARNIKSLNAGGDLLQQIDLAREY